MPTHKPHHHKSGEKAAVNLDMAGPVNDNARGLAMSHRAKNRDGAVGVKHSEVPHHGKPSHSPQASGLPGSLHIIHDVRAKSKTHGIPGILNTTTTSPETRGRLLSGIIEHPMVGHVPQGPVEKVLGHDATAYNAGSVHIRGSHFK